MSIKDSSIIEYKGFSPGRLFKKKVKRLCEKIYWSTPSDTFISMSLCYEGGLLRITLRVSSLSQKFSIESSHSIPRKALELISQKVEDHLDEWKANRFKKGLKGLSFAKNF